MFRHLEVQDLVYEEVEKQKQSDGASMPDLGLLKQIGKSVYMID